MIPIKSPFSFHIFVIVALLFISLGAGFLLSTTGLIVRIYMLWPVVTGFFSALSLYLVLHRNAPKKLVYISLLVLLYSLLILLIYATPLTLGRVWPLFVIVSGIAMFPAGFLRYKRARPVFIVPGSAFLLLGGLFCIFSFGFSSMSFRSFITMWWPAFFLAGGLMLFIVYFVNKSVYRHKMQEHSDPGL